MASYRIFLQALWKKLNQKQSNPWTEKMRTSILKWIYIVTGRPRKARFTIYQRRRFQMCFESSCPCCPQLKCWKRADELLGTDVKPRRVQEATIEEDNVFKEGLRSLGGFVFGLLFTSVYGLFVLFVQEYNIWYCLVSTITIAVLLGLGMGLSAKIRINVFLMLPHVFSKQGRAFLLALAFGLVVEGPLQNIIVNFTRGSESIACGAELALNQTKELMQKAKEPLIAALEKIKNIARSAKGVGDRVRKFFISMKNSIRHIVRILQNLTRWMSNIGVLCNKEMGEPYRKCIKVFDDAINHCLSLLSIFGFLCYIVNIVKPLCGLATVIQWFCLIPSYIKDQLNKHVGEPISEALEKLAKEFEFNISIEHHFHIHANQSKSFSHVALDIMEEIRQCVGAFYEGIGLFGYGSTLMMLFLYIQALLYRKNYLFRDDYDNCYITNQFLEIDVMRAKTGKSTILPLRFREACKYIRPWSFYMTVSEKRRYILGFSTVLRQSLAVVIVILLDYTIFWVLDMVSYHLQVEIVARSPVILGVSINGTGYASDIYRNMVASFDVVQSGNITVVSRSCAIIPSVPNYKIYTLIGVLYGMTFFIVIFGCYISRLRRYVCSVYYPSREQERICYLYNQITSKRKSLLNALFRSVQKNSTDAGHTNIILVLAARYKLFAWIASLAGMSQEYCMACGRIREEGDRDLFVPCITPGCKGLYCTDCYQHMNNICSMCMGPLAYQGDIDEEVDSSDSGKVKLWVSALKSMKTRQDKVKQERKRLRTLLKEKIKLALYEDLDISGEKDAVLRALIRQKKLEQAVKEGRQPSKWKAPSLPSDLESGGSGRQSTKSETELEFAYQDQSAVDGTSSDEPYDPSEFIAKRRNRDLVSVSDLKPPGRRGSRNAQDMSASGESSGSSERGALKGVRVDVRSPDATTTSPITISSQAQTDETYTHMDRDWQLVLPDLD
ncbi:DC-STAMP domain-containing protein 2-like [Carcharodon carcharias]|uniref:DC-STAMP domain-containing protein 2-like n=1 Tax=Carcharodon carcharias TaxID=13397 RepID=UPI001B7E6954|nr:DC-STAMP domain-containing protein 2-like [Carcharodon carcharias]